MAEYGSDYPTMDGGNAGLSPDAARSTHDEDSKREIVKTLQSYYEEARHNREGGLNPRDQSRPR